MKSLTRDARHSHAAPRWPHRRAHTSRNTSSKRHQEDVFKHPCIRGCCCRGQPRRVLVRSTRGSVRRGPHGAQDADAVVQAICIDICRHSNLRPASEVRALATCSAAHTKTQQAETHLSGPRAGGGALTRMQLDMASSCARGMRRCMALLRYSGEFP
ncbi:hypothetical protein PsYK624_027250 [Phanerochaete sordida]|uniref:Uncharacterized protein n=1 Tax=Phanerochaete sordida TaxID=48140 RepID=A0A9P3G2V8_9APHY|nr:hypothetical protein PsYK624_027250 [Phanerochaete sordida]